MSVYLLLKFSFSSFHLFPLYCHQALVKQIFFCMHFWRKVAKNNVYDFWKRSLMETIIKWALPALVNCDATYLTKSPSAFIHATWNLYPYQLYEQLLHSGSKIMPDGPKPSLVSQVHISVLGNVRFSLPDEFYPLVWLSEKGFGRSQWIFQR